MNHYQPEGSNKIMSGKLSVAEAAAMIGKSERTLYRYINQGKIKGNKIFENGKETVNIPISELERIAAETKKSTEISSGEDKNASNAQSVENENVAANNSDESPEVSRVGESRKINPDISHDDEMAELLKSGNMVILPVDLYNKEKEERDKYFQGMMMYRFKYEELESKLKLLPAPVEVVSHEFEKIRLHLDEKEKAVQDREKELLEQASIIETKELALKETDSILQSVRTELYQSESELKSLENAIKNEQEAREKAILEKEALAREKEEAETKAAENAARLEREKKEAEEKLAKEKANLEELLRKKEVERREMEDMLKIENSRSWWKKLFGMK